LDTEFLERSWRQNCRNWKTKRGQKAGGCVGLGAQPALPPDAPPGSKDLVRPSSKVRSAPPRPRVADWAPVAQGRGGVSAPGPFTGFGEQGVEVITCILHPSALDHLVSIVAAPVFQMDLSWRRLKW
jgi:hypothetical protein